MDKRFRFTLAKIKALPTPQSGRYEYRDTECNKLACRVTYTGHRSYSVIKWDGRTAKRITLGNALEMSVKDARKKAMENLTDIANGIDPIQEKRKAMHSQTTMIELLDKYLSSKQLKPRTVEDYRGRFQQGFGDWANKPVSSITKDMILARHKKTEHSRDNKFRVLRLLMSHAVTLEIIDRSPIEILSNARLWHKPKRKTRIIPANKLKDWYKAVMALESDKGRAYLVMLLHTGCRANEALSLKWSDVSLSDRTALFRDTKNHSDFTAYLSEPVIEQLSYLHTLTGDVCYVFQSDSKAGHMTIPVKQINKVIKQTGIEFSSHDLRRTFATIGEAASITETLIKKLLNHETDSDVTTGYIRTEEATLKEAINKIASFIQARVNTSSNVIQLKA